MAKNTAVNLDITNNTDGFDVTGGNTNRRKLTLSGGDISMAGSGTAVITFPSTTGTLANIANSSNLTGTIVAGGNSLGAAFDIGSSDNFGVNFRTNATTRIALSNAGEIQIGTTGSDLKVNPAATSSAMVEITASTRGLLIPRMTRSSMTGITSPADNLLVSQTDSRAGLYRFSSTGSSWLKIGDEGITNTPAQITSNQANYNPSNMDVTRNLKVSTDTTIRQIQGLTYTSIVPEDRKTLINNGSTIIQFPSEHPSATAANRFSHSSDFFLLPGNTAEVRYDGTLNRWKFLNNNDNLFIAASYHGQWYDMSPGSVTAADHSTLGFNAGTGAITASAATSTTPAATTLSTSTSATGASSIFFTKDLPQFARAGAGVVVCRTLVSIPTLSNGTQTFTFDFGMCNGASTDQTITQTNAFGLRYSHGTNSGKWQAYSRDGLAASTTADAGVTVAANTLYELQCYLDMARSEVRFYINGTYAARITTNLPDANALMGCRALILKSAGTTATVVNVHRMSAAMILP